jgi:hypothetical protein
MRKDAAHKIEQEFYHKLKTNPMFKEFVELHDEASMDELLGAWVWVETLVQKAIHRTIRDLTGPPPPVTLSEVKKDR